MTAVIEGTDLKLTAKGFGTAVVTLVASDLPSATRMVEWVAVTVTVEEDTSVIPSALRTAWTEYIPLEAGTHWGMLNFP